MKIHTPPELRFLIIIQLKLYYKNIPVNQFSPEQQENILIIRSITLQNKIG